MQYPVDSSMTWRDAWRIAGVALVAVLLLCDGAHAANERLDLLINSLKTERDKKYLGAVQKSLVAMGGRAVTPLIKLLEHPSGPVRYRAAATLVAIGDPRAKTALTELLDDPYPEVQAIAVRATGVFRSQKAIDRLLGPLRHYDSYRYRESVRASIIEIGETAGPALLKLLDDPDDNVKVWALGCLGAMEMKLGEKLDLLFDAGGPQVKSVCVDTAGATGYKPLPVRAMTNALWSVRRHAVYALGELEATEHDSALVDLLKTEQNPHVRSQVVSTLGRLGGDIAAAALRPLASDRADPDRVAALFALGEAGSLSVPAMLAALCDEDAAARRVAAHVLGDLGAAADGLASTEAVEALLAALTDTDASVRKAACMGLAAMPGKNAIERVARQLEATDSHHLASELVTVLAMSGLRSEACLLSLLESKSENVRGLAAEALGAIGSSKAVPRLIALFDPQHGGPVNQSATVALAMIGSETAVPLVSMLADEREPVGRRAEDALVAMRGGRVVDAILAVLDDKSPRVRASAIRILGARRDLVAVPRLVWMLNHDRDLKVRVATAVALGCMQNKLAIAPLARATRHESPELRRCAVLALGKLGDKKAVPILEPLLADVDLGVVDAVQEAMTQLTPQNK